MRWASSEEKPCGKKPDESQVPGRRPEWQLTGCQHSSAFAYLSDPTHLAGRRPHPWHMKTWCMYRPCSEPWFLSYSIYLRFPLIDFHCQRLLLLPLRKGRKPCNRLWFKDSCGWDCAACFDMPFKSATIQLLWYNFGSNWNCCHSSDALYIQV